MADEDDKNTPATPADDSVESELVTDDNGDTVTETTETTEDAPEGAEAEPTENNPAVEGDPAPELTEPDFPGQIADLNERINTQQAQIETLTEIVSRLQEENADLIESLPAEPEGLSEEPSTGDDFLDELFA